jgi:cytoskeletal protein CcmA (bactofilin family)
MSYFSKASNTPKTVELPIAKSQEIISTLGSTVTITGQIVCAGALEIYGQVSGNIHAAGLTIAAGAVVEGDVTAQEVVVQGEFKGKLYANNVTMAATAVVSGEVFNRSLSIEKNAEFEGVARRLEKPVEGPAERPPDVVELARAKEARLS